jgi:putative membrane protein
MDEWINYEWIKALHIMAVIAWMSGMLYLPRLMVYHCEAEAGSKQSETFKVMERRLNNGIIIPAMIAVWILGLYMAWDAPWYDEVWLQAKVVLVLAMSGIAGFLSARVRDFANDKNTYSQKFYRIINEVPAVLIVLIVLLVVLKPFR